MKDHGLMECVYCIANPPMCRATAPTVGLAMEWLYPKYVSTRNYRAYSQGQDSVSITNTLLIVYGSNLTDTPMLAGPTLFADRRS